MSVDNAPTGSKAPDTLTRDWKTSYSVAGSLVLHLALLGGLAIIALPGISAGSFNGPAISVVDAIDTTLTATDGLGDSVELSGGFAASVGISNDSSANETDSTLLETITGISDSSPIAIKTDEAVPLSLDSDVPAGILGKVTGPKGKGKAGGQGSGSGSGSGTGTGDGTGTGTGKAKFFGTGSKHKSIVFVVDASGSMNKPYPGPMRTRFNRVKLELLKTISEMTEEHRFFILFFGDDAIPMPAREMTVADDEAKRQYLTWMAQIEARSRKTLPQAALLQALKLEPEAIYFLTDGVFPPFVVANVTRANSKTIPIHTIGFSEDASEQLLVEFANMNNGTYTFISSDEKQP